MAIIYHLILSGTGKAVSHFGSDAKSSINLELK